jgi:hypothetical protein
MQLCFQHEDASAFWYQHFWHKTTVNEPAYLIVSTSVQHVFSVYMCSDYGGILSNII